MRGIAMKGNGPQRTGVADAPRWDLTSVYPSLQSKEFNDDMALLRRRLDDLDGFMSDHGICASGSRPSSAEKFARTLDGYLVRMNEILCLGTTLNHFVYGFIATDSYNAAAKRIMSNLEMLGLRWENQSTLFQGWLGSVARDRELFDAALRFDGAARTHSFYLRGLAERSKYMMSEPEESLASELSLSGADAWGKLQAVVTSQVKVTVDGDELPIAVIQGALTDSDPERRRWAYEQELAAWKRVREPLAACLNGVKGASVVLNKRRGRRDALHEALDQSRIDRKTLDALLEAMRGSFPVFRRYWKAKARRLGREKLPWWDLWAPVGAVGRRYGFCEARDFILEHFGRFHGRLAEFAQRAFERNWIDAEPRDGKQIGGFCMELPLVEESRILCNYDGSLSQLLTVAHELGHAYHNECLIGRTMLQRITPMTLAETSSILAQNVVTDAAIGLARDEQEELAILESDLIESSQVIVDIYSRFLFEKAVFERRADSELSADELCELMARCQKDTYGDALDEQYLHPYMWAWKPHYYSLDEPFYNFPYAFGLLFGMGLYKLYLERGEDFLKEYDELLGSTGLGRPADLAARFGIVLDGVEFWREGLEVIEKRVDRYLEL